MATAVVGVDNSSLIAYHRNVGLLFHSSCLLIKTLLCPTPLA